MTHRILAALALIALAGCGALPAQSPGYDNTDHARMAAVEHAALLRGAQVLWINPPRKNASGG